MVAAVASLVLVVATFVFVGAADRGPDGSTTGLFATLSSMSILTLFVGGLAALIVVRHQVFGPGPDPPAGTARCRTRPSPPRSRRASAAPRPAVWPRRTRCSPTSCASGGRTCRAPTTTADSSTSTPRRAQAIARTCGIAPEHAERIVACRSAAGRFATVEDVFVWADLPYEIWDYVRDRAVVLGR